MWTRFTAAHVALVLFWAVPAPAQLIRFGTSTVESAPPGAAASDTSKSQFLAGVRRLGASPDADIKTLGDIMSIDVKLAPTRSALRGTVEQNYMFSFNMPGNPGGRVADQLYYRYGLGARGEYIAAIRFFFSAPATCITLNDATAVLSSSYENLVPQTLSAHRPLRPTPTALWAVRFALPSGAEAIFSFRYEHCVHGIDVYSNLSR